ncbi:unnamed protein product [Aphanomyces euteiches]
MTYHETCEARSDILLMDPAVVSCMMLQCDDEEDLRDLAQGLQLREKSLILLPINDRQNFDSQGSHWALLVYCTDNGFQFYDSSSNHNRESAEEVAAVLQRAIGLPTSTVAIESCPQQQNAFDCGISRLGLEQLSLKDYVTPKRIRETRQAMPDIVQHLKEM